MNNQDHVIKILDNRTPFQASKNYEISKENEDTAMKGLIIYLNSTLGLNSAWSELIDDEEEWGDGKFHIKPDFFLYIQKKGEQLRQWTVEVKTTAYKSFLNNEIIIKAPQTWTCKNDSKKYPNPYILAATYREFALIPMGSFWNTPAKEIKFGDVVKKGYVLNCDDYEWHPYLIPLDFMMKEKNKYGDYQRNS